MTIDAIIQEAKRQKGKQMSFQHPRYLLVSPDIIKTIKEFAEEMSCVMPETLVGLRILESDFVENVEVR